MTSAGETKRCVNCGREHPVGQLDAGGWCADCRKEVIRRATLIARGIGLLGALLVGYWVVVVIKPGGRFAMAWVVLLAAVYYLLYTLTRRVSFEVIHSRRVPRRNR